jgi:hypothetical protein
MAAGLTSELLNHAVPAAWNFKTLRASENFPNDGDSSADKMKQ